MRFEIDKKRVELRVSVLRRLLLPAYVISTVIIALVFYADIELTNNGEERVFRYVPHLPAIIIVVFAGILFAYTWVLSSSVRYFKQAVRGRPTTYAADERGLYVKIEDLVDSFYAWDVIQSRQPRAGIIRLFIAGKELVVTSETAGAEVFDAICGFVSKKH